MASAKALETLGYLVLVIGVIGGIAIIIAFEDTPVGIAVGVGIMFEHIILGVFLIVVAHIGIAVYQINKKLSGEALKTATLTTEEEKLDEESVACPNCGHEIMEGVSPCPNCGAKLKWTD